MSKIQDQLQTEVDEHNELHRQIQATKEQIVQWEVELHRRYGRVTLLQELAREEADSTPEPESD